MDRPIQRKAWTRWRVTAALVGLAAVVLAAIAATNGSASLSIDAARLAVSQVRVGEFQEYVAINGSVQPITTVFLDLEEGGIVEKIFVEGGNPIEQGELILAFSNTTAQKQNIETETRLLENLNQLRNSKITLTQSGLALKDQLLDLNHNISEQEKTCQRFRRLMNGANAQISKEQFESAEDLLKFYREKRTLLEERIRQEKSLERQQIVQIDSSIERVNRNLEILSRIIDSLEVRAPIRGQLSTLNAQVGQSFQRGQRIGQIDQLDDFKVRAEVDQFYIGKVVVGQVGSFEFDNHGHRLSVTKIYPEVTDNVFQIDMAFMDQVPSGIKRGQTLRIDLSLSEPKQTLMIAKGSFYRHTNGRWVYRLSDDRRSARRTNVVLGRQNPQSVEVLDGLKIGDWILSSNYEALGDVDELSFPEPVEVR